MFSRYLVITLMMVLCSSIGLNFMAQLSKSKFVQSEDYESFLSSMSKAKSLAVGQLGTIAIFKIAVTGKSTLIKSQASARTNQSLTPESTLLTCISKNEGLVDLAAIVSHAEGPLC
jgi:hypothetical protein